MARRIINKRRARDPQVPLAQRVLHVLRWASAALLLLGTSITAAESSAPAPDSLATALPLAFPGAEGFGRHATGWRGGEVIAVTTLDNAGPGSLRDCAEGRESPRICTFAISGTIVLDAPIMAGSNLYIAGQTAPGMGVQLRLGQAQHTPLIIKNAHDVVVRFLKLRPGPSPRPSPAVDALTLENARSIYLGNLSLAFATDETFNIHVSGGTSADITLADSILALGLDRANHPKGRHSKGALICSDEGRRAGVKNACGRITLLRNLFAHHRDRNPDIKGTGLGPIEVINSVFYNPISQFGEFYDLLGPARIAYLGNVALRGPSSIRRLPPAVALFEWTEHADLTLLAADNQARSAPGCRDLPLAVLGPVALTQRTKTGWPLSAPVLAAPLALPHVLRHAGDRTPTRPLDVLDAQVVADIQNCSGRVIDHPEQVGGWPDLPVIHTENGQALPATVAQSPWALDPTTGLSRVESWLARRAGDLS